MKGRCCLARHQVSSIHHQPQLRLHTREHLPPANSLRNQKNLIRVRILHFRSRREAFDIDIFARRVRALDKVRFARNGHSMRIISRLDLCRCCSWRRWSGRGLHGWRTCRLNGAIRIERLLRWRVLFGLSRAITRGPVSWRRRLRLFTA